MIQIIILTASVLVFLGALIPVVYKSVLDIKLEHLRKLEEMNIYDS